MNAKFFLDTNILVYSFDDNSPKKQTRSRQLIRDALVKNGCISWQVMQEFCNVALHKFVKPINRDDLRDYMEMVLIPLCSI